MKPDVEAWLKRRGYVHFDRHISSADIEPRVLDPKYVARHGFMPFIGYDLDEPRYDRANNQIVSKQRPIRFASHLDSHIFAYYSQSLTKPYEEYLLAHDVTENVVAYRKHPIAGQRKGGALLGGTQRRALLRTFPSLGGRVSGRFGGAGRGPAS